ncbi:MAG: penicillin-binding protein 2 [Candidatus Tectomicrobia bacterium]|uniref:Penicillin-binding protein 2 n=1 Tax=Tectimicrobiota bacterium TaxID=2528274 RepID=A0A932GQZ0_UNCTE|nr:penicillin-binding protein 2 [Candidatus Tectomicrobia bacterium]
MVKNRISPDSPERFQSRFFLLVLLTSTVFFILLVRLWYLQVIKGDHFRAMAEENRFREFIIKSPRGKILDRNGQILVESRPSFNLYLRPEDVPDLEKTLKSLSPLLGVPLEKLKEKVRQAPPYRSLLLKRDVSRESVAYIEEHLLDLPGVMLDVEALRSYRHGPMAAHLLGYLGEITERQLQQLRNRSNNHYFLGEFIGQYGLEMKYEGYLRGIHGARQVEVDALGRELALVGVKDTYPGSDLQLTLDLEIQQMAETLLGDRTGAIIVMDPRDGAILALAGKPSYNPNQFAAGIPGEKWLALLKDPKKPLQNRAIQGQYPPASVFKIVVAAAALEEGVITPNTLLGCPAYYFFGNRAYRNWKKENQGPQNLTRALATSCDTYFYQVAVRLGVDKIGYYAKGFGLGKPTGFDPMEKGGLVPTSEWKRRVRGEPWYPGETVSLGIGQGPYLITPLQQAIMISAIANGGKIYKPYVVRKIVTPEGKVVYEHKPELISQAPVKAETLEAIRKGLWAVVNESGGTGGRARIDELGVAGKTGTAQVVRLDRAGNRIPGSQYRDHSWFVSYAPFEDPQLAVVIFVENSGVGGSTFAPIAKEIFLKYFNIPKPPPPVRQNIQAAQTAPAGNPNGEH